MPPVVLDTNVVLDAFVFRDERTRGLADALRAREVRWLATASMRDELSHVLAYPQIVARMGRHGLDAGSILARFDGHVALAPEAPCAAYRCKDPDDQKFVDLAVAHRAHLVSKDRAVLTMRNRLLRLGCPAVTSVFPVQGA